MASPATGPAPQPEVERKEQDPHEQAASEPRDGRFHGQEGSREGDGSAPFEVNFRVGQDPEVSCQDEQQHENRDQGGVRWP